MTKAIQRIDYPQKSSIGKGAIMYVALILMLSFCVSGEYALWMSDDFDNYASMLSNGWINGSYGWTGGFSNNSPTGFFSSNTSSTAIFQPKLQLNITGNNSVRFITEVMHSRADSVNYLMFGFVNNVNRSDAISYFILTTMTEVSGGNFIYRTYADGSYCSVNDSSYRTTGSQIYNRTILFNITYASNGSIAIYNNQSAVWDHLSYSCPNLTNMTMILFSRLPSSEMDYVRFYLESPTGQPNITSIAVNSPANNTIQHSPLTVNMAYTGNSFTPSANCTLFINGSLYNSSVIAQNNISANISIALGDGNYSYFVRCVNTTASYDTSVYMTLIDNTVPYIYVLSPANHSIFDKRLNLTGYAMNTNLDIVNLSIYNMTGIAYHSFYESNITATIRSFTNESINTTSWADGMYNLYIEVIDSANNSAFYLSDFNITSCVPDWLCVNYSPCNISDMTVCNAVSDANLCEDESYTGNYSEYGSFSCDYCVPILYNLSPDVCIANIRNYTVENINFGTCCNVTLLASDCVYNGYNMLDFDGFVSFYENCEMPPQEIDLGFDVFLVVIVIICIVLVWLGITSSFSVFALIGGLGLVISGAMLSEIPAIRIFLIMIGIVTIFVWGMLAYNES